MKTLLSVLMVLAAFALMLTQAVTSKPRVLLVPGLGGSQLKASMNKPWPCRTRGRHYSLIWVSIRHIVCIKYLKLRYNPIDNSYKDTTGVQVIAPGFGRTETVECLTNNKFLCKLKLGQYMAPMVKYFTSRGYRKNTDIRAAPYDWRLDPDSLCKRGYYKQVKKLIEKMYNGKGITIVAHSFGGPVTLYFLNEVVTPSWKAKYIKAFIPMAAPFGGSVKPIGALLYGELPVALSAKFVPDFVRKPYIEIMKSLPGILFNLPRPEIFGRQALVKTPTTTYSSKNYKSFFAAIKHPTGYKMYQKTRTINSGNKNPSVKIFCMYGTGKSTQETYTYKSASLSGFPHATKGDGDGSVNLRSLQVCDGWKGAKVYTYPGVGHTGIVKSKKALKTIYSIVNSACQPKKRN